MLSRTVRSPHRVDLRLTLGRLGRGPCGRFVGDARGWVTRTPLGPASVRIVASGRDITVSTWGPGADVVVEHAEEIVGACDDPAALQPRHAAVADSVRRTHGLCIPRPGNVVETLLPVILEQKVQAAAAHRSYAGIVRRWGEPAPGPAGALGLFVPPDPAILARVPSYALHPLNIERKRADTFVRAARLAASLAAAAGMEPPQARARLQVVPGVGAWTSAEVALHALGDADAVPVGDYHLPNLVSFALAGEARGDDARMLELLEPYRGQRGRVIRVLAAAGVRAPKFGPRRARYSIARV